MNGFSRGPKNRKPIGSSRGPTNHKPINRKDGVKPMDDPFGLRVRTAGNRRDIVLFLFFCLLAAALIFQLVNLQVFASPWLQALAEPRRQDSSIIPAKRGIIYDRNYNVLAQTVNAITITAQPKQVADPQRTAETLAMMLGGKAEDYYRQLTVDANYVVISKAVDYGAGKALMDLDSDLDKVLKKQQAKTEQHGLPDVDASPAVDAKLAAAQAARQAETGGAGAADSAADVGGAGDAGAEGGSTGDAGGTADAADTKDAAAEAAAAAAEGASGAEDAADAANTAATVNTANTTADTTGAAANSGVNVQFPIKAGGEATRLKGKDNKQADKVEKLTGRNPLYGIYYEKTTRREYPYGDIGMQVIGKVSFQYDEAAGKELLRGDSGIERQYNELLTGSDGLMSTEYSMEKYGRPLSGMPIPGSERQELAAIDGQDIVLSIDIQLQQFVEQKLVESGQERNCENGNALVLDGANGEILATASLPLASRKHLSQKDVQNGATNAKAISLSYEPGSIFKPLTAAALFEEKLVSPDDWFYVSYSRQFIQDSIHDSHPHPDIDMSFREIIAQSSNVGTSWAKDRISDPLYANYLKDFGICEYTGVDFPGEENGWVSKIDGDSEPYPYNVLKDADNWADVRSANISFGQGINVTSLQMASFYGAVANDGIQHRPHFLVGTPQSGVKSTNKESGFNDGSGVSDTDESVGMRIMRSDTASSLQSLLRSVVTDGTGSKARIEGYNVAGKTGTAQKLIDGVYSEQEYVVSFVGFLEASDSKLVCITSMDNPERAEYDAPTGPLFSSIMKYAADRYMIKPSS